MLGCPPQHNNTNKVRVEEENGAKRPIKMTCLFGQGWRIKMVIGGSLLDCWIKMNWLFGQGWRICRVTGGSLEMEATVAG